MHFNSEDYYGWIDDECDWLAPLVSLMKILRDLHDLAEEQQRLPEFQPQLARLAAAYDRRSRFQNRLKQAQLRP
ncbi:MAG: hypothetical protein HC838_15150 [Spirulinaceae cyanobacterium RM2_2_10]|nr:hypothetical protein [Spirulinaceae cyanobacterium SM2_1_0]NJO21101.1 hypothetical protein [Spirulinaceae cyanobacterium RM2_2_10]